MQWLYRFLAASLGTFLLFACMAFPASASTTIRVAGTPSTMLNTVNVWTPDVASGITAIEVGYSWDHYVHIESLPRGNHVNVLESYTCVNLGPCNDFIASLGIRDNPGHVGQNHVSIHHNVTLTFFPRGTGNTVVDEHYEHGGIPWISIHFGNGHELYVDTVAPGYALGRNTAPHVEEFYIMFGPLSANFVQDVG